MAYTTRVALQYPNGRSHTEILTTPSELTRGSEFDLYGHHWQVVGWEAPSRSRFTNLTRTMLCSSETSPVRPEHELRRCGRMR